jgi:hypothetical protein
MVTFFYSLFGKGLILGGRRGIFYALQRLIAEATLSLMMLEERFREKGGQRLEDAQENLEVNEGPGPRPRKDPV